MSSAEQITVLIPTPLRRFTGGESRVQVIGADVSSALDALEAQFPGLASGCAMTPVKFVASSTSLLTGGMFAMPTA